MLTPNFSHFFKIFASKKERKVLSFKTRENLSIPSVFSTKYLESSYLRKIGTKAQRTHRVSNWALSQQYRWLSPHFSNSLNHAETIPSVICTKYCKSSYMCKIGIQSPLMDYHISYSVKLSSWATTETHFFGHPVSSIFNFLVMCIVYNAPLKSYCPYWSPF